MAQYDFSQLVVHYLRCNGLLKKCLNWRERKWRCERVRDRETDTRRWVRPPEAPRLTYHNLISVVCSTSPKLPFACSSAYKKHTFITYPITFLSKFPHFAQHSTILQHNNIIFLKDEHVVILSNGISVQWTKVNFYSLVFTFVMNNLSTSYSDIMVYDYEKFPLTNDICITFIIFKNNLVKTFKYE